MRKEPYERREQSKCTGGLVGQQLLNNSNRPAYIEYAVPARFRKAFYMLAFNSFAMAN